MLYTILFLISLIQCGIPFNYPSARRDENIKDNCCGKEVLDPYRWLEDGNSDETKQFIDAQNSISTPYLNEAINRNDIHETLNKLWNCPKQRTPIKTKSGYYYLLTAERENQPILYRMETVNSTPVPIINTNLMSSDGNIKIEIFSVSEDGKILGYGLSENGSDWISFRFKNLENGNDLPDVLKKTKFSDLSWTHDNKGVFYSRLPHTESNDDSDEPTTEIIENHKLYYHRIGTSQSEDILCVEFSNELGCIIQAKVSECGKWLVISVKNSTENNLLYFADLRPFISGTTTKLQLKEAVGVLEANYEYITNIGSKFLFRTNQDAPKYKIIVIDFENHLKANWETLILENRKAVMERAVAVDSDKLVISYIKDVKNVLEVYSILNGSLIGKIQIPMGTVESISSRLKHSEMFLSFTSFFTPSTIYRCNFDKNEITTEVYFKFLTSDLKLNGLHLDQVFYPSKDGTKIPMYIMHKESVTRTALNPTLLLAFGGFGISLLPVCFAIMVAFIKHFNGVFAVANIRGGGEYGQTWHDAGKLLNKQNGLDDFHAAAEYLIRENYTNPNLLSSLGDSNGGLLVAACANQRPDLYAATLIVDPLLDMLRYNKFTIGWAWIPEFGNPEIKEDFENIYKYSPLHNIKVPSNGQYPATLVLASDGNDRIVPAHAYKFIATLQHTLKDYTTQTKPLLLKVDTNAGQGIAKPLWKWIEDEVDILSFLQRVLNLTFIP